MTLPRTFATVPLLLCALASVGCGGSKAHAESPAEAKPQAKEEPRQGTPEGCEVREGKDETIVGCFEKRIGLQLPLTGWKFEPRKPGSALLVDGSLEAKADAFFITVLSGTDDGPSVYDERAALDAVFEATQAGNASEGLSVTGKEIAAGRHEGRLNLSYEIIGKPLEEAHARSLHVWTAQQREDGSIVFYHVSWIGPGGDPSAEIPKTLSVMADLFFVLSADGKVLRHPAAPPSAPAQAPEAAAPAAQK